MDLYKVAATGLSINYLPEYIADKLGYFKDVDIKLETYVPKPWTQVLKDINSGTHHAVCGGIWVPSIYRQYGVKPYAAFAKVSSRAPFRLVSRVPMDNFTWRDLEGKMILVPADGGASAYIFLAGCMKEAGVDLNKVRFIRDFSGETLVECFEYGNWGDLIYVTPPVADRLVRTGKGFIVCEMSKMGGPVPWSVYYSTPEVLNREDNLNGRFALALQRGLTWLRNHKGEDCRDILKRNWPQMDLDVAISVVDNFLKDGMWAETIQIGAEETEHYAGYQVDAGIINRPLDYDELVDSRPFNYVAKNLELK